MNRVAWILIPVLTLAPAWAQAADSSGGAAPASASPTEKTLVLCGKVVNDGKKKAITELYKPDASGACNKGDVVLTSTIKQTTK